MGQKIGLTALQTVFDLTWSIANAINQGDRYVFAQYE